MYASLQLNSLSPPPSIQEICSEARTRSLPTRGHVSDVARDINSSRAFVRSQRWLSQKQKAMDAWHSVARFLQKKKHTYTQKKEKKKEKKKDRGASCVVSGDFPSFVKFLAASAFSLSNPPRRPFSPSRFISRTLFARRFFATPPAPVHHLRRPDARPSFPVVPALFFYFTPRVAARTAGRSMN